MCSFQPAPEDLANFHCRSRGTQQQLRGGGIIGKFMKQKKPKSTQLADNGGGGGGGGRGNKNKKKNEDCSQ